MKIINIFKCCKKKCSKPRAILHFGLDQENVGIPIKTPQYQAIIKGEIDVAKDMKAGQHLTITVEKFVDKNGNEAKVDGAPKWLTDNSDLVSLVPAEDGMSCLVTSIGMAGPVKVQMNADADLSTGEKLISAVAELNILPGDAATAVLTIGEPQD